METTVDAFLGGQLSVEQPLTGYRAGTDPVLLAASIDARTGDRVLDMGCGVGVASLCLGRRIGGAILSGVELQSDYAALAKKNARSSGVDLTVEVGDVASPPLAVTSQVFDHVMTNPPYYPATTSAAEDAGKALADRETLALDIWIKQCLKRVKPRGYFTIIHLADRLPDILKSMAFCGEIAILPIAARQGRAAKRVIVRGRTNSNAAATLSAPLIMHDGAEHDTDRATFSARAVSILRDGQALKF